MAKTENPTAEERLNFLEALLRGIQAHEHGCAFHYPKLVFTERRFLPDKLEFEKRECDCWLREPFGSVGWMDE